MKKHLFILAFLGFYIQLASAQVSLKGGGSNSTLGARQSKTIQNGVNFSLVQSGSFRLQDYYTSGAHYEFHCPGPNFPPITSGLFKLRDYYTDGMHYDFQYPGFLKEQGKK